MCMLYQLHNFMSDFVGEASTPTQVGLSTRGMGGHTKYQKVFIEEVSTYVADDWWADQALPFPHMHVVRPTGTGQKCYNVIDVTRILGPAMVVRDPATLTVPKGALPRSAAERVRRFPNIAED